MVFMVKMDRAVVGCRELMEAQAAARAVITGMSWVAQLPLVKARQEVKAPLYGGLMLTLVTHAAMLTGKLAVAVVRADLLLPQEQMMSKIETIM